MKIDFNKMNNREKIEFISERDGYIKDEIGVDSCGNEFRDDNGSALFVKEIKRGTWEILKNKIKNRSNCNTWY